MSKRNTAKRERKGRYVPYVKPTTQLPKPEVATLAALMWGRAGACPSSAEIDLA
jgi:hypothetical protein